MMDGKAHYKPHASRPDPAAHNNESAMGHDIKDVEQCMQDGSKPLHRRDVKLVDAPKKNPALSGTEVRMPPPYEEDRV